MFRKIIFIAVAVVTSLFTSCRNGSGNNSQSAQTSPESQNISKLEIPEVPSTITDPQLKAEYLIRSFWKNYDFKDTTKLQNESYTEGPLYVYLSVVKKYSNSAVREIYSNFLNGLMNSAPKVREKFLTLIEYNYYHPNSQIRDENLYSMAIDKALLMSSFPKGEAERYLFQKKIMARNNAGSKASDFTLQTKDGSQIALSQIKSKYLVLILFDPECEHCIETIENMQKSPLFLSEKVKVVAVMAENNKTKFINGVHKLPNEWISGFDFKEDIMNNLLYDLRPSPSLYLLDEQKRVIIKDGYLPQIEEFLAGVI